MKAHVTTLLVMQNATGLTAMAIIRIRLLSARKLSAAVKHITTCSHIAFVICGKGLRNLSMKCQAIRIKSQLRPLPQVRIRMIGTAALMARRSTVHRLMPLVLVQKTTNTLPSRQAATTILLQLPLLMSVVVLLIRICRHTLRCICLSVPPDCRGNAQPQTYSFCKQHWRAQTQYCVKFLVRRFLGRI